MAYLMLVVNHQSRADQSILDVDNTCLKIQSLRASPYYLPLPFQIGNVVDRDTTIDRWLSRLAGQFYPTVIPFRIYPSPPWSIFDGDWSAADAAFTGHHFLLFLYHLSEFFWGFFFLLLLYLLSLSLKKTVQLVGPEPIKATNSGCVPIITCVTR